MIRLTLHIREWLECIRQGKTPSCNIDAAFQEAMTAHMGTRVIWKDVRCTGIRTKKRS